ncbi:MAG: hypothetical protein QOD99_336 [Chthoniobacter sp.]|jgi:hypothetical protein|nr:hypothetical protein [Chthoniobacter sp.]
MKLLRWTRFTWELATLPEPKTSLESHYRIRMASRDEEETVRHVVMSAFALDSAWADTLKSIREWLDAHLDETFAHKGVQHCLVITHGTRIIGASAITAEPEAETHLLTGPCILNEYCNRGLGSLLLHQSLVTLRELGLERARAISKDNVPASKFVFPKFQSVCEPIDFEPALVGS